MKDRIVPCIHYTCPTHGTCEKGFTDVTVKKCQHCQKYMPRKTSGHMEPMSRKRQKDKDRHDNWKKSLD